MRCFSISQLLSDYFQVFTFLGVLQILLSVLRDNKSESQFNSFTMTVWYCHTSCPILTYQWCVRRRDLRRGSATTQCKGQGTNFHIHQCANPKFKHYFQFFTKQTFFSPQEEETQVLDVPNHQLSSNNQNTGHIWLAAVISHPDSLLSWLE